MSTKTLVLIIGIILITAGLAVISYMYYPLWGYYLDNDPAKYPYPTRITENQPTNSANIPQDNRLVVPVIGVDIEIVEGAGEDSLNRGAWHHPDTAQPGEEGNMVVAGHRFQFQPPNNRTFYLLDKLQEGDYIIIYWSGREYDYVVQETYETDPQDDTYLQKGHEEKLTLYTCTPLFSTARRLVVVATRYTPPLPD